MDKIENLQKKPESYRYKVLFAIMIVIMAIIIAVWISILRLSIESDAEKKEKTVTTPFDSVINMAQDTINESKSSFSEFNKFKDDFKNQIIEYKNSVQK